MRPPRPPVADWLAYLGELGYEEIYRQPALAASAPGGGPPQPPAEASTPAPSEDSPAPVPVRSGPAAVIRDGVRAAELARLAERAAGCTACPLAAGRQLVVFGSGPVDAGLMVVGEGPGAEEDRRGLPFVGRAGELLTRILAAIGLSREEVYIANIVKCRPPGNREPEPSEVAACIGYLERQIELVRPALLVALGKTAAQTLLGASGSMAQLRGPWYDFRGVPLKVTYHPAALLRNPALKRPTWEDMQEVRDRLLRERPPEEKP
ncbi:MAG: uracil-DNA glycosylase [Thermoanaerobaculia bacterium]|nr:uracil-DNA glycosylase [Thermoanaerobaculia bacterium]